MGFGGISIWQLLIVLAIIVLLFGTKKLRNIGADLGNAVKGFKKVVSNEDKNDDNSEGKSEDRSGDLSKTPSKNSLEKESNEAFKTESHGETVKPKETAKAATEKQQ